MNADEKQLIADVFARLQNAQRPKDQDADMFIRDLVRQFPDAPYYLTQSVIIQQQALQQADARVSELEATVRNLQPSGRTSGASFLGGRRGDNPASEGPGPWGSSQPPKQQGGFLSSVLSTAAGVAGGVFLADSIRSLFGSVGGRSYVGEAAAGTTDQAALDRAQDQTQDAEDDAAQARKDLAADDAALDEMQDAQDESDDWNDDGGMDT
jgi:hypothetical protein